MAERAVEAITEVRSEYTSARLIALNLEHRLAGTRYRRHPGYVPPEIDYVTGRGETITISIRDGDVRFLDRVPRETSLEHLSLIHSARRGDAAATAELRRRTRDTHSKIAARFAGRVLIENDTVVPYTTRGNFTESQISHKGAILLDLFQRGFATADFSLLAAGAYGLCDVDLEACARDAVRNLEILSGRNLGDPDNPLLMALRSALPEYIPGFMPTYLNVGLTPDILPGLPSRYGEDAAARIRLNSRKTILEALDPEAFRAVEPEIRPHLNRKTNLSLAVRCEDLIARRKPLLLDDPMAQVLFFLKQAYRYYENHLDVLRNFMLREVHVPAVIIQRMVCSVIDRESYAGVLYSRHPRLGTGAFLQLGRAIFGEDLMTGRLVPEERHLPERAAAKADFPAVFHFWDRLGQLEDIFRGPVMVEFTGVHGTFTILQVNAAEMSGAGMLTAVMDMHRRGRLTDDRVRELIKPYHVRQIESDAIDPRSLHGLTPFGRGVAVLPRSAVTGRIYLAATRARRAREERGGDQVVLAKDRFTPQDAIDMQHVGGICSLSPAAIHVVTTAQNLGIPALLNLEESGVRIDPDGGRMLNREGVEVREGDWVTISSRMKTLYLGRAVYAPARLLRYMAGEDVGLSPGERPRFERLASYYRDYHRIIEAVDAAAFESLHDLGHAIRYGELRGDENRAAEFVNRSFDLHPEILVRRLLEATLGTHLINRTAFERLTVDRRMRLFKDAARRCRERGRSGYQAGAFVIGSFVDPRSPAPFWARFDPGEIAFLLNEWVLHQKYLHVLDDIGERKLSRVQGYILSRGLRDVPINHTGGEDFGAMTSGGVDLDEVRDALPADADPDTASLIDSLRDVG